MSEHRQPDDGTDVGTDELTARGGGTARADADKAGNPRPAVTTDDGGVTGAAAREVETDHDDEPTRSE